MKLADLSRTRPFSLRFSGAAARFASRFVLGAAAGALAWTVPAFAVDGFGQAEWAQHYDADASVSVERSSTPLLSPHTLAATEAAIAEISGHRRQRRLEQGSRRSHLKLGIQRTGGASLCASGSPSPAISIRPAVENAGSSIPMSRRG